MADATLETMPFDEYMVWLKNHIQEREAWARQAKAAEKAARPKRTKAPRPETPRALVARSAKQGAASKWTVCDALWRNDNGWIVQPPVAFGHGVYAIYADKELVYIGTGDRMNTRVAMHLASRGATLRRSLGREVSGWMVKYRPERFYGERATLELRLIRRLAPALNRNASGRGRIKSELPGANLNQYRYVKKASA